MVQEVGLRRWPLYGSKLGAAMDSGRDPVDLLPGLRLPDLH